MTFLNAALLGGVAALAIPILIHLFHKSRFKVVQWGAMHLLETVIRTNRRRLRVEQLILLLIRCAIPVLLALAMARPLWKGAQQLLGDAPSSNVLLLDNSYSMEAARAGVANFSVAREEAARLLTELKRGSEASVILIGQGGGPLVEKPTSDLNRLAQSLQKTSARTGPASMVAALEAAGEALLQTREASRQIVVLTDFQRVSFPATENAALARSIERLKKLPIVPHITFFNVGAEIIDNVSVESLDFSRLVLGVGQKLHVRANLRNHGNDSYPDLRVFFKVDGREKSVSQIALGPKETGQLLFSHLFDSPGSHVLEVYAEADAVTADNAFLAATTVRDKVPVLLVNGDPGAEALKGETDFAEIALQPYRAARVEQADLIKPRVIKPEELDSARLEEAVVVILANVRRLGENQVRALEEFVRGGGGLLIFPGNRVDGEWWNRTVYDDGSGLLPLPFGPLAGDLRGGGRSAAISAQHFENPALELFNDPRNGTLADSSIRLWLKIAEGSSGVENVLILARLDTGDPFLVEKAFGAGRVIACATALDADWSNLPMRPFYLPLLQRLSVYLASTIYPPRNLDVGSAIVAFLPETNAGAKVALSRPDGRVVELPAVKRGARAVIEYGKTDLPGLYELRPPGEAPLHYVVTAPRRESELERLSEKEIVQFTKENEVTLVRNGNEYRALEKQRRPGREIWKPFLWMLLGVIFLEIVVEQRFARARGRR